MRIPVEGVFVKMTVDETGADNAERVQDGRAKRKRKAPCRASEGLKDAEKEPYEAVHSTLKKGKTGKKKSPFCTKGQAEYFGVTSWMIGSTENPCMSQRNCSGERDRRSLEVLGHEKRPHSTRL